MAPLPKLLPLFLMIGLSAAADDMMGGGMDSGMGGGTDPNSGMGGTGGGPAPAPNGMPIPGPQCDADNFNVCANTHSASFTVIKMGSDGSCTSLCAKDDALEAAWASGYVCGLCPPDTAPTCPGNPMPICANTSPTSFTVSRSSGGGCEEQCYGGADLTNALASGFTCGACPSGNTGAGNICPNMDAMVPCGANMDMAIWVSNSGGSCQEACLPAATPPFTQCGQCPTSNPICPNMGAMTPCTTSSGAAGAIMIPTSGTCTEQCVAAATPGWMCGQCPDPVQPVTCPANSNMESCGNGGFYVFGQMNGDCMEECSTDLAASFARGWACGRCPTQPDPAEVCPTQMESTATCMLPGKVIRPTDISNGCMENCATGTALADMINSGMYQCGPCPSTNVVQTTFAPNPPVPVNPPPTPPPVPPPTLRPVLAPVVSNVGGPAPVTPNTGGGGDCDCSKSKSKGDNNNCKSKSKGDNNCKSKSGSKSENSRASVTDTLDANSAASTPSGFTYGGVAVAATAALVALVQLY